MEDHDTHYSLEELAELVDLPIRTIRYYISEDLLPGPGARGKAAIYGEDHLLRLRLIRLLARQHLPLGEIHARLRPLSINEIRTLLAEEEEHTYKLEQATQLPDEGYIATLLRKARSEQQPSSPGPLTYPPGQGANRRKVAEAPAPPPPASAPASALSNPAPEPEQWQRWELTPGVELHVKIDSASQHRNLLERIFQAVGKHYPFVQKSQSE